MFYNIFIRQLDIFIHVRKKKKDGHKSILENVTKRKSTTLKVYSKDKKNSMVIQNN